MKNKFWVAIGTLSLGLFLPQAAFALGDVAKELTILLFHLFLAPFILILKLEMLILPKIAAYNNFINEKGVVQAWIVLRDVANMFFILVLLFIAFATILRVKSYGFKQLLSRFIIVVILVNFSRTIIGLAVDLFQVVMLTFVNAIQNVMAGNIMVSLGLTKIVSFSEAGAETIKAGDFLAAVIFGAIMLIVAVVVIGVFIFILAMRIVKIWFYVVAAPLAFLSYTVPRTAKYFDQWVDGLLNTIIVGPVIAFLLWLSFTIVGNGQIATSFPKIGAENVSEEDYSDFAASTELPNVLTYVIGIAVLFGSLMAAQKLGTGGKVASMAAGKLQKTASSLGRNTGRIAWSGTSGQGMLKGGLSATSGAIGSSMATGTLGGMATAFGLGRVSQQAGLRMQAKEATRKQAKRAYMEKGTAGMSDEQKMQYYASYDSRGVLGRRESMVLNAQLMVDRAMVKDHKTAESTAKILREAGDTERVKKLQLTRADAYGNNEEIAKAVQEKGPGILSPRQELDSIATPEYEKDAKGNDILDSEGKKVIAKGADGNNIYKPTEGAKLVANEIINNDNIGGEELVKAIAALPPKVQDVWMSVFRDMGVELQNAFKEIDGKKIFNSDSNAGKQIMIGMQNAPQQFVSIFKTEAAKNNLKPEDLTELFGKVSKGMDFGKLAKMDINVKEQKEAFENFVRNASNAQQRQLFDKGSEKQIERMVKTLKATPGKQINPILNNYTGKKEGTGNVDEYDAQQGTPT